MVSRLSMKAPNIVGDFLWNLSIHRNYEDGSNKSQKNQHNYRDLREISEREKSRRGGERFHYNNGDYNSDFLVC